MLTTMKLIADTSSLEDSVTVLQLHEGIHLYKTEDILSANKMVYEDFPYSFEVDEDLSSYASVVMYFNREKVSIQYRGNQIFVRNEDGDNRVFKGLLGFLQIVLYLEDYQGNEQIYYSEYASIMVKQGTPKSRNVESMLRFIYENQKDLLYASANVMNSGKTFGEKFNDFGSELKFLDELADVYERNVGYFRANSRFKLEQVEIVDSVYKMQYVNEKTIRHIVEHPDLLRVDKAGIKVGKNSFLPDKTLMPQNKITLDIYENQVIVGFLKKVLFDTKVLKNQISDYINASNSKDATMDEYVPSSNLIFSNVLEVLKEYRRRAEEIYDRFLKISSVYARMLPVHDADCSVQPKPTQIFLSVPQYNQIYTAIHKWYQKTGYDFSSEKVMLQLMDIPSIYEIYILVKLIQKILSKGYELIYSKKVSYPNISSLFYRKESNNTFVFEKEGKELTLYYEPAIYNSDSAYNGINLFRNTSVSFIKAGMAIDTPDSFNKGTYYVPDFVIKYKNRESEKYVIMDAKYTPFIKAHNILSPELVYKYIFSITPANDDVQLAGLGIFNGIYRREPMQSLYDSNVKKKVTPFVDFIPLSEEMPDDERNYNLEEVWKNII